MVSKWITCTVYMLCMFIGLMFFTATRIAHPSTYFKNVIDLSVEDQYGYNHIPSANNTSSVLTEREKLYEERWKVIIEGCKKVNKTVFHSFDSSLLVDKIHFIYYCSITKVSSTFWKKTLTVMSSQGKVKSPFKISKVRLARINELSKQEMKRLKESGTSFMFIRDPYARLFSGYESKLYQTNLVYWKQIGKHIVNYVRNTNGNIYKNYGFDVHFPEFIKYILYLRENRKKINYHFSLMSNKCDPCSTHYDFIGKLETFNDDAKYLISKWQTNIKDASLVFSDFEKESAIDTARLHVRSLFAARKIVHQIKIPFIKLMIRTWRDLQIRGFLSKSIEIPFKDNDTDRIKSVDYMNAVLKALAIPANHTEVMLQRYEALEQAYRYVPLEDMERLREYVLPDCLIFGYDDRPLRLFNRSTPFKVNFLYLDGL